MPCIKIEHGWLCTHEVYNLTEYGAQVWMTWHSYLGPTFYRSENLITPIQTPSKKTWDAFERWQESRNVSEA